MTQIFNKKGLATAATILKVQPSIVVESEVGKAIIGSDLGVKPKKPIIGKLIKNILTFNASKLFEIKSDSLKQGDIIDIDSFKIGEKLTAQANSKGKGFSGTVKRHNFSRGPKTHGSDNYRRPGSIGAQQPQRVIKGKKMAGQMGNTKITIHNLEILEVNPIEKLIMIKGSIPGPSRTMVKLIGK